MYEAHTTEKAPPLCTYKEILFLFTCIKNKGERSLFQRLLIYLIIYICISRERIVLLTMQCLQQSEIFIHCFFFLRKNRLNIYKKKNQGSKILCLSSLLESSSLLLLPDIECVYDQIISELPGSNLMILELEMEGLNNKSKNSMIVNNANRVGNNQNAATINNNNQNAEANRNLQAEDKYRDSHQGV